MSSTSTTLLNQSIGELPLRQHVLFPGSFPELHEGVLPQPLASNAREPAAEPEFLQLTYEQALATGQRPLFAVNLQ